ncbi:fatty acyl-AMP ligase [Streptomyces pseudovenezuelae]|uniref:fatty acyl-AMP ligase n=1 Tax=Streptomyces pseudovenezuelae TaxID=67350 RepID=UPI002E7FDCBF|nr:fatty acyl-AMP ligase [Streptomyces pseudovenezuelae]WUA87529.1 fatty acyl-AMP ligase [Streptomyces pseudovenezuelae]
MPSAALQTTTEHLTLGHALASHAEQLSTTTALVYGRPDGGQDHRTYAELYAQAAAVGAALHALPSRTHDRPFVLIALPNGVDYVASFFGCLLADAVAVTFHPPLMSTMRAGKAWDHRLEQILRDCEPSAIVAAPDLHSRVRTVADAAALNPLVIAPDEIPWDADVEVGTVRTRPEHLALLQYTSGSTSSPKGAMVSNANLAHNIAHIRRNLGTGPGQSAAGWLPLFHDMGLIGMVCHPLTAGMSLHMSTPTGFLRNPLGWLRTLSDTGSSFTIAPDFGYATAVQKVPQERREGLDLSGLRHALNGAEPVRRRTVTAFTEAYEPFGFSPHAMMPVYGLAEATLVVTCLDRQAPPALNEVKRQSLGGAYQGAEDAQPGAARTELVGCGTNIAPDIEVAVVDPETSRRRPTGEVGEIWISGPSVAGGYWGHEKATRDTFRATVDEPEFQGRRFLRTGDLGVWHEGQLCIAGRIKDMIIHRGTNHHPQDLEATAEGSHELVARAVAFATRDEEDQDEQVVLACELLAYGPEVAYAPVLTALRGAVLEEHGIAPAAVAVVQSGAVPRTTSGKLRRAEAAQRWSAGEFKPVAIWRRGKTSKGELR